MAYTKTATRTFVRMELLKLQVRITLRRATQIKPSSLESIVKGLDHKWIRCVNVYGLDKQNTCRAQLTLEIDWDEYNFQISTGRVRVSIDEAWVDDTAVEIDEMIQLFSKFVSEKRLTTRWTVAYHPEVDQDEINQILGFKNAKSIKWAGRTSSFSASIPELSELRIGLNLAE